MKKIFMVFVVCVLSISMLAGCGGGAQTANTEAPTAAATAAPTATAKPTEAPTATAKPTETAKPTAAPTATAKPAAEAPSAAEITVAIVNSTGFTFLDLYISPSDEDWGDSLLGPNEIEYGDMYSVAIANSPNTYDILAIDDEGDAYVIMDVTLEDDCEVDISLESAEVGALVTYSDGTTAYVEGSLELTEGGGITDAEISVAVVNSTGFTFTDLYISPSDEDWGNSLLGPNEIEYGDMYSVGLIGSYNTYDILAIDDEGDAYVIMNVTLVDDCEVDIYFENSEVGAFVAYSDGTIEHFEGSLEITDGEGITAAGITVAVVNSTGYTFIDLYISPSDEDWGSSQLGPNTIEYGDMYSVGLIGSSSTYDILAVDEEGDSYVIMNVVLEDQCEVDIYLENAEVGAQVTYSDGSTSYVEGVLELSEEE